MAFSPVEVTLIASAVAAVTSVITATISARFAAKPSLEASLNARIAEQFNRYDRDLNKLESVARDLEVMVVRMIHWAEDVEERAELGGLQLPPRPRFADRLPGLVDHQ